MRLLLWLLLQNLLSKWCLLSGVQRPLLGGLLLERLLLNKLLLSGELLERLGMWLVQKVLPHLRHVDVTGVDAPGGGRQVRTGFQKWCRSSWWLVRAVERDSGGGDWLLLWKGPVTGYWCCVEQR